MNQEQEDRLIAATERAAAAYEAIAAIAVKWYDSAYPPPQTVEEAVVYDPREAPKEAQSKEEYAALTGGKGRYQTLIEATQRSHS